MSATTSDPAAAVTAEELFTERHGDWSNFYRFVWSIAGAAALMVILMAIFLT